MKKSIATAICLLLCFKLEKVSAQDSNFNRQPTLLSDNLVFEKEKNNQMRTILIPEEEGLPTVSLIQGVFQVTEDLDYIYYTDDLSERNSFILASLIHHQYGKSPLWIPIPEDKGDSLLPPNPLTERLLSRQSVKKIIIELQKEPIENGISVEQLLVGKVLNKDAAAHTAVRNAILKKQTVGNIEGILSLSDVTLNEGTRDEATYSAASYSFISDNVGYISHVLIDKKLNVDAQWLLQTLIEMNSTND